jgi:membrane associated rhomboid family serine protease
MQQQMEVQTLVERGKERLLAGRPTEAAELFAQAAQLEPNATAPHLGIAQANLALNEMGVVYAACRQVIQLDSASADAAIARALLAVVEGRYEAALEAVDEAIKLDPGRPYAHALRGYCLRQLDQRYEGALAEARAARGWGTRDFGHLFPKAAPAPAPTQTPQQQDIAPGLPQRITYDAQRPWSTRSPVERRLLRVRVAFAGIPTGTFALMAINIAVYLACAALSLNLFAPYNGYYTANGTPNSLMIGAPNPIYGFGLQQWLLIAHNPLQAYRIVTAMFLHEGIEHIALNMLSLYFVGIIAERAFGTGRFLLIYFISGIAGGLAQAVLLPTGVALGASGAIFGIFGAYGAFLLLRRSAFGSAGNAIGLNYLFWLGINIWFTLSNSGTIGVYDHFVGLGVGFFLGLVMVTSAQQRRQSTR